MIPAMRPGWHSSRGDEMTGRNEQAEEPVREAAGARKERRAR
jgi:hypothetical protein